MEMIIYIIVGAIGLVIPYFIIKAAVKNGVKEAFFEMKTEKVNVNLPDK